MDKFGIFKLLNSFLDNYKNQATNTTAPDTLLNGIETLFPKKSNPPKPSDPPYPLQKNMLSTMQSHDQFVKRVKEKNT